MKGRQILIRLNEREVDDKRRRLADLDRLLDQIKLQAQNLETELVQEQARAGADREAALTYGAYAQHIILRREKLAQSIRDLEEKVLEARDDLASAFQELKKFEIAEANFKRRKAAEELRIEQAQLDEVAVEGHRRKQAALSHE
jgi:flagellar export protein FliJ